MPGWVTPPPMGVAGSPCDPRPACDRPPDTRISTAQSRCHKTFPMKPHAAAAVAALLVTVVTGCSSASTSPTTAETSRPPTATTPASSASSTPLPGATSTDPSATTDNSPTPTATGPNVAESLGQDMGAKIAFYAIAKAAGMNDSAKMDDLAKDVCSRVESGK